MYADHILGAALDSSRYIKASYSVPFVGVVLHGYTNFTGTPLNMEGDVNYAKLKAIENGASVYFTLSYQNTQKLKEDIVLNQYYSVRYDIWFDDVVEIYNELNAELKDVQNKLIIDHQFLSGMRVPDVDELDRDLTNEFNTILDFQNNKAEYEEKQQAEAVADARDKIARVEVAAEKFVKDCITYYSGISGAAYMYVSGDRSFERRLAIYVEAKAAYDEIKAEYDAADPARKKELAPALATAEGAEKQAQGQLRTYIRNVGRAIQTIEKEHTALTQLLADAQSGKLLINSTAGCPQSIIDEIELQLANTEKTMQTTLGVAFNMTVDKAEIDTFLYTHISTLVLSCYGEADHNSAGVVGKAEKLYEMLANEDYGLLIYEMDLLRYLDANKNLTDDELIAKYGLKADQSSMDGLILYVSELLGESYDFDPVIENMESGVQDSIRDYFVSMLLDQVLGLSEKATVPALNFVPKHLNKDGKLVSNTTNINNVKKLIDDQIKSMLTGTNGIINRVQDGDYTLSKIFTEEQMNKLVNFAVEIIRQNTRTEDNAIPADKAVEYATPDTMKEDIRNYIEGSYYRAVISKLYGDVGKPNLQIITVATQTNSSIDLLVSLRLNAYEYDDETKYEDLVKAMRADTELQAMLDSINDSVKGAYGDVRVNLEKAFVKTFATQALGKDKAPLLEKASYEVEDAEGNKTKHDLRTEASDLLNSKLTAASTQAEVDALIAEIVALHANYADKLPDDYDATADVTDYVYFYLLKAMSNQVLRDVDNYFYDAQMAKLDAALRAKADEKIAAIKAKLPADYDVYDVYAEVAAVLGDPNDNAYAFVDALMAQVTHTADGKFSLEDDALAYYSYLLFAGFEGFDLSEAPTLSVAGGSTKVKNALKILDKDFEDRLPLLIAQAKENAKRGQLPNYSLADLLTEDEMKTVGDELVNALIKAKFAEEKDRETLHPETLKYLQHCYYTAILELLAADELPKFHVSEVYPGTLSDSATGLKNLMYYYVMEYTGMTEDEINALIEPKQGLGSEGEDGDEASRYLSDDGRIVSVTYGTKNADGSYTAYKTFILNYNNFSVNVDYDDVTYTIPAYGYVVVMH